MDTIKLFLEEIDREAERSRRMLERIPAQKRGWKPHDRSMALGGIADMVAGIFAWVGLIVTQDELDLNPPGGSSNRPPASETSEEFIAVLEKSVAAARAALEGTNEDHLRTPWRLLVAGNVVMELPRHEMIRDTLNHLAHHRGQMTVYLRLMGVPVPSLYGPSADDSRF